MQMGPREDNRVFQIDAETGIGEWVERESWPLAPFRGIGELADGLRHGTLTRADRIFLAALVLAILGGGGPA